ncbi:MAG: pyridoxal-phosphate dependent enzyme [Fodinibius sp.]|nr:pyridoxal-phosphate dependent enzyme [Fodinibius sp.]
MIVEDIIGNTPIIELTSIPDNPDVTIYCKLEGQNPGGSVKDRAALGMINGALERGDIQKGDKLVEATSGNTGIALAMIASMKGLQMTLVMPEDATPERIKSMKAYGADVILTPADQTIEYSRTKAEEMAESGEYFLLNQFGNPDNYRMHYRTTGPEIWRDTEGEITHFVSAMGTTGTIMGVSRYLKEQNSDVQIGRYPAAPMMPASPAFDAGRQSSRPDFYEPERVDQIIDVSEDEARTMTRRMAKEESIMAGMSSGGALTRPTNVAGNIDSGTIVCITCDRGDRYLSSDLFA